MIERRVRQWALRRQGEDPLQTRLASERIYVLPTPAGLVFAGMLLTMLAGAMNYNNNLGFALTFLLASVGIVGVYHTHRMIAGLQLTCVGADAVFAGDPLHVRFRMTNDAAHARLDLVMEWSGTGCQVLSLGAGESRPLVLPLPTTRRGVVTAPALRISSRAPLGLTRAWAWLHLAPELLAYPQPAREGETRWHPGVQSPEEGTATETSGEDFSGLRPYQRGDPARRIAWKAYARRDILLVPQFHGGETSEPLWIDWDLVGPADTETRVARLTRLVLDAGAAGRPWGLILPGKRLGPGHGSGHLRQCLRELALVPPP